MGADLPGGLWLTCPRAVVRDPMLWRAAGLCALADVSPLAGWPDAYSVGMVECMAALRLEQREDAARAAREAQASAAPAVARGRALR